MGELLFCGSTVTLTKIKMLSLGSISTLSILVPGVPSTFMEKLEAVPSAKRMDETTILLLLGFLT